MDSINEFLWYAHRVLMASNTVIILVIRGGGFASLERLIGLL